MATITTDAPIGAPASEDAQRFQIEGMDCAACVHTIQEAVSALDGADSVRVSLANATLLIEGRVDPGVIERAVAAAGYHARPTPRPHASQPGRPFWHSRPQAVSKPSAVGQATLLAWIGLGWHAVEAAVAIATGVIASSIALVGFGADSLIELLAGAIVLWRLASGLRERRAQQLIAVSFCLLSLYVTYEAIHTLATASHPRVSWPGIALSIVTLATMPPLAIAKQRVAAALDSSAAASESRQTMLCAYLSAGLLVGLALNAALGWWWADPLTALGIAAVAIREGRDAWRGHSCCTTALAGAEHERSHNCC